MTNYQDVVSAIVLGAQIAPDGRRVVNLTIDRDGQILTKQVFPVLTGTEGLRTIGIAPLLDRVRMTTGWLS